MQIDLLPEEEAEIRRQAVAVGYDSPGRYLVDLAIKPEAVLQPLTDAELRASAAMCDRGMQEADAGLGVPMRKAILEIASELGLADPSKS
jgi:hypothetical protein